MWVRHNKHRNNKYTHGFTIVELLIVIVVIAILAAITITAYNGITNRANDSAIQSDFSNLSKLVKKYQAETGKLPASTTDLATLGFKASRGAYDLTNTLNRNLLVCGVAEPGNQRYAFASLSKSGKWYTYSTSGQLAQYDRSSWPANSSICTNNLGFVATETGYWAVWAAESGQTDGWFPWAR